MRYLVLFLCTLFFLVGCNEKEGLSENAAIAKNYLEEKGYEIVSYESDGWNEFSKSQLITIPNRQMWSVQYIEPDEFLDKRIDTVTFTIKNHPLDEQFNMGKTTVTVWFFDGEVIGGLSIPGSSSPLVGGPYSLYGQTAEEIHGDGYEEWYRNWIHKYGN